MLRNATIFLSIFTLLFVGVNLAQNKPKINKSSKMITLTGDEVFQKTSHPVLKVNKTTYPDVVQGDLTFDLVGTDFYTGYDAQSNGTTDEIWQDPLNPENLHAVFTSSQETGPNWTDRTVTYFYSFDSGISWISLASVPTSGERSGYPSINGFNDGTEIIALHSTAGGGTTRSEIFIDQSAGSGSFNFCDPGVGPSALGPPIWPRIVGIGSSDYIFTGSISVTTPPPDLGAYINTGNASCDFTGYEFYPGDQAETYSLAYDDSTGTIGHLFLGDNGSTDVLYRQSTDGAVTWSDPDTIWKWNAVDSLGCIRGCDLAFFNHQPVAVFEIGFTDPVAGTYGPTDPSYIYFWSPPVNGGEPMVIADSNSVPFYTNYNSATNDVMIPITRPTIGVSTGAMNNNGLFVGFMANTDQYLEANNVANSYYAAWFTYSVDSGQTWTAPVKFTPEETPLRDWRYLSMSQNNAVVDDSVCTVHMVIQADTIPGSTVNVAAGYPVAVSAELVGVNTTITIPQRYPVGVAENNNKVYSFKLAQNYPNPFNPTTKISYSVAERNNVSLKVYDMLGREVSTLVNTTKDAGNYEVNFDASKLASGLYIYKIQSGNFVQSKKMLLLK